MYGLLEYERDLNELRAQGARVFSIGKTELGRDIYAVQKGSVEGGQVLVQASMHAREYLTTQLVMTLMKEYSGSGGIWAVPMVNIDGVLLTQEGLSSVSDVGRRAFLLDVNGGNYNFSLWKANANAVDLNVNYNADWSYGAQNVTYPSPANYIGRYPMSQSENVALARFTLRVQPRVTLSYHTKGNVIYWGYKCNNSYQDEIMRISELTGYQMLRSDDSAGGYKDWFLATTPYLGITLECGNPLLNYPLPASELPNMIERNRGILELSSEIANEINP